MAAPPEKLGGEGDLSLCIQILANLCEEKSEVFLQGLMGCLLGGGGDADVSGHRSVHITL